MPGLKYSKGKRKKERKSNCKERAKIYIDGPRNMLKITRENAIYVASQITRSIPSNYLVLSLYENDCISCPTLVTFSHTMNSERTNALITSQVLHYLNFIQSNHRQCYHVRYGVQEPCFLIFRSMFILSYSSAALSIATSATHYPLASPSSIVLKT